MKLFYQIAMTASAALLIACSGAETPEINASTVTEATSEAANKMDKMGSAVNASDYAAMETKTKAVLVYADWCGSCKVLDPKIKSVQSSFSESGKMPGLEFVTLDYTDKNAENFYAQAEAAGVGEAVKTYLDGTVKTGQLLLVDLDDQKVIGKVTKTDEPAQIILALKTALTAS